MTTSRKLSGGRKKRGNGHKMNCGCPICKNMRKSKKRGGADDDMMDDKINNLIQLIRKAEYPANVLIKKASELQEM